MRGIRAFVVLVGVIVLGAVSVPAVTAQTENNDAVAVNKHDGKSVFKLAFSIRKNAQSADANNAAVAYASCTDCRTVAAAIQVVLVSEPDDTASPTNTSLAINYDCSECETLAAAYQFVFADGQPVELTKEGKAELNDIKHKFHDLKQRDDLTIDQLAAEIAKLAGEVAKVVDTQVVPVDNSGATTTTMAGDTTTSIEDGSSTTTTAGGAATTAPPTTASVTTTSAP
jgi:putative peptide zinc metalloprotease protein